MLMRKFTLSLLAIIAATTTCSAQTNVFSRFAAPLAANHVATAAETSNSYWLPMTEIHYTHDGNDWQMSSAHYYEYDHKGNITSYSEGIYTVNYSYDENNMKIEEVTLVNTHSYQRKTWAYDPIVKDAVIEYNEYTWDNNEWVLVPAKCYKNNIVRNAQGNIESVEHLTYVMEEFTPTSRMSVIYNSDNVATSLVLEEAVYGSVSGSDVITECYLEEYMIITDIEWQNTDGQIFITDSLSSLFDGNNRMKKATLTAEGIEVGAIEATYKADGGVTYKITYPEAQMEMIYTIDDKYGSATQHQKTYYDMNSDGQFTEDELAEDMKVVVINDEHGNKMQESMYSRDEMMISYQYYHTYNLDSVGTHPTITEIWGYDFETGDYIPELKYVYADWVEFQVLDGINEVETVNSPDAIFTIQGVRVTSAHPAPGLYIKVQNGKATKVLVK